MFVAQLHEILMPCCVESLCIQLKKGALKELQKVNDIIMPSLENWPNRKKRKEMWQTCSHKKHQVILWRSMNLSTALRSLKLYRMHVNIPLLCPHPFCVYICVCISWGLVTTSRFRNNGPRADILHMDRCGEKKLPFCISLFLSASYLA